MVVAYRVCKRRYAPGDASGAARVGGRWNSPGRGVIYCGMSQAGSMLEILAHLNRIELPGAHHVAEFAIPDDVAITVVSPADVPDWNARGMRESRAFGDAWLASRASAALIVPCVVAQPYEQNVVIDPAHPDFARIIVQAPMPVTWDARLVAVE